MGFNKLMDTITNSANYIKLIKSCISTMWDKHLGSYNNVFIRNVNISAVLYIINKDKSEIPLPTDEWITTTLIPWYQGKGNPAAIASATAAAAALAAAGGGASSVVGGVAGGVPAAAGPHATASVPPKRCDPLSNGFTVDIMKAEFRLATFLDDEADLDSYISLVKYLMPFALFDCWEPETVIFQPLNKLLLVLDMFYAAIYNKIDGDTKYALLQHCIATYGGKCQKINNAYSAYCNGGAVMSIVPRDGVPDPNGGVVPLSKMADMRKAFLDNFGVATLPPAAINAINAAGALIDAEAVANSDPPMAAILHKIGAKALFAAAQAGIVAPAELKAKYDAAIAMAHANLPLACLHYDVALPAGLNPSAAGAMPNAAAGAGNVMQIHTDAVNHINALHKNERIKDHNEHAAALIKMREFIIKYLPLYPAHDGHIVAYGAVQLYKYIRDHIPDAETKACIDMMNFTGEGPGYRKPPLDTSKDGLHALAPEKDTITFLDPGLKVAAEFNTELTKLIGLIQEVITPYYSGTALGKKTEDTQLLTQLNDAILDLEIALYGMREEEKSLGLTIKAPEYMTLPSTWFLSDTGAGDKSDKKPAAAKGSEDLERIIKEYQPQVTKSFDHQDPSVKHNIDLAVKALAYLTDIYDPSQQLNQEKKDPQTGKPMIVYSDEGASGVTDEDRKTAIKFLNDTIAISEDIKQAFMREFMDYLVTTPDKDKQIRMLWNITKYGGKERFNLPSTFMEDMKKQQIIVRNPQHNQSKKNKRGGQQGHWNNRGRDGGGGGGGGGGGRGNPKDALAKLTSGILGRR
jgi:hypothetical protein